MCGFFGIEKGFDRYSQSLISAHCNATDVIISEYCLIHPWGWVADFFIQADEGGLTCNQCACALYVITTKSCMASRRNAHIRQLDYIQHFVLIPYSPYGLRTYRLRRIYPQLRRDLDAKGENYCKNLLLEYSEELATKCELLCRSIKDNSNTVFQLRKSSSSVFANITEAQYPQNLADMLSKFKISRKKCVETESWLKLLYNTKVIDEETFKTYRNLCGRIQRLLTSSCITIEKKIDNK